MSISLTFRTEENKRDQLDKVAGSLDRNRNWVINEAIDSFLELYRWQLEEIEKGIADHAAGLTHSAVQAGVRALASCCRHRLSWFIESNSRRF